MKITICCKQFVELGGAEVFLMNFARRLLQDGHQVRVLTPRAGAHLEGVHIVPLAVPSWPRALADLLLARASRKALADESADVTFSDQRCWGADVVRVGGGVQREYVKQRDRSYRGPLRRGLKAAMQRVSLRERLRVYIDDRLYDPPGPLCIIANSDMVRRELIKHYPHVADRIRVVYNGADTERFSPELKGVHFTSVRQELGIPSEALVGVFVGHDWRRKGLSTFIEALGILACKRALRQQMKPAYGIIVGRGRKSTALSFARKAGAQSFVRFTGPAQPDRYYGAADLLVLPSYYDPCANATMEALACGLPVITSIHNGAFELLTLGLNGFYVNDPSDSAQLAGFIEYFMDRERLTAGSQAARALALEYPASRMYGDIVSALLAAAQSNRRLTAS